MVHWSEVGGSCTLSTLPLCNEYVHVLICCAIFSYDICVLLNVFKSRWVFLEVDDINTQDKL